MSLKKKKKKGHGEESDILAFPRRIYKSTSHISSYHRTYLIHTHPWRYTIRVYNLHPAGPIWKHNTSGVNTIKRVVKYSKTSMKARGGRAAMRKSLERGRGGRDVRARDGVLSTRIKRAAGLSQLISHQPTVVRVLCASIVFCVVRRETCVSCVRPRGAAAAAAIKINDNNITAWLPPSLFPAAERFVFFFPIPSCAWFVPVLADARRRVPTSSYRSFSSPPSEYGYNTSLLFFGRVAKLWRVVLKRETRSLASPSVGWRCAAYVWLVAVILRDRLSKNGPRQLRRR